MSRIGPLVVLLRRKGTQARSDGVVRTRFDPDVIWRIGVDELDLGAGEKAVDVLFGPAVA